MAQTWSSTDQAGAYKMQVSGAINTEVGDTAPIKRIFLLDRTTMMICGIGKSYSDGTFLIKSGYQPDESLVLIGFDDGDNYNADIYDRISLCSEVLSLPDGSTWRPILPQGKKIWTSTNFASGGTLTNLAVNGTSTGLTTSGANTGTWVSSGILMTRYDADGLYNDRLDSVRLGWAYPIGSLSVNYATVYRGYVSLNGGTDWTEVTINGGEVAGIDETTELNGVSLSIKMEIDSLSGSITPRLIGVCLEVY